MLGEIYAISMNTQLCVHYTLVQNIFPLTLMNEPGPDIGEFSLTVKKELPIKQNHIYDFNVIAGEQQTKENQRN